ncbi:hypothetical protein F2P47_10830 [Parvibaculum sedimenti]|uniref:Tyrosine-type recombinase/integrase n=2 Tax=Parvibaculum sedimenti TaxID=2608632 RepID=A0A6N6VKV0_9HYPH|nr:hypothetical protein F2P47_10830 [Parvibaculum sedimenti]
MAVAFDDLALRVSLMAKRREPTQADLDRLLLDIFNDILTRGEQNRIARPQGYSPWVIDGNEWADEDLWMHPSADDDAEVWRTLLEFNRLDAAYPTVEAHLSERNLEMPRDDGRRKILLRMALATIASACAYDAEREEGVYRPVVPPFGLNGGVPLAAIDTFVSDFAMKPFSEVFKAYADAKVRKGDWSENSANKNPSKANLFIRVVGDIPFTHVQRRDALRFREVLERLPRLHGKSIYTGLAPADCVARADTIATQLADKKKQQIEIDGTKYRRAEAEKFVERLDPTTINATLSTVGGVFEWEHSNGAYPGRNPFDKLQATKRQVEKRKQGKVGREMWEPEHLEALFASPVWTGCASEKRRNKKGAFVIEDARFWLPLIALFAGLRADEALTLYVEDIREHQGIWFFDLYEDGDRSYKTKNSTRIIPIHEELIRIGILEYRDAAEAAGFHRLFEDFGARNKSGKFSDAYSRWFGDYRRDVVGQGDRYRDFHALRTTFDTFLERNMSGNSVMVRRVMGHQGHKNGTTDDYFKGYEAKDLKPLIDLLQYPISLAHLYVDKQKRLRPLKPYARKPRGNVVRVLAAD